MVNYYKVTCSVSIGGEVIGTKQSYHFLDEKDAFNMILMCDRMSIYRAMGLVRNYTNVVFDNYGRKEQMKNCETSQIISINEHEDSLFWVHVVFEKADIRMWEALRKWEELEEGEEEEEEENNFPKKSKKDLIECYLRDRRILVN